VDDLDRRALEALYAGTHGVWGVTMTVFTVLGAGWSAILLVPLLWHARSRAFAAPLTVAIAVQAVLVWATKAMVGRVRPWIALGLPTPIGAPHDGSFPSGHAAGAFCLAAFLALALPAAWPASPRRARMIGVAAFIYAALVACSRVVLGAHFPTDVLCGALLGGAIGAAGAWSYVRSRTQTSA
jgi:undecaprenyl-diphosphatase